MEEIQHYFPELSAEQLAKLRAFEAAYRDWNRKINVISRRDLDALYRHHVLHSLGIAKVQPFLPGSQILDVGTGGGFPGLPLAVLFPQTQFHLVDSTGKKIRVVREVIRILGLRNTIAEAIRAEAVSGRYDFAVSRAVTTLEKFVPWVRQKIAHRSKHPLENGILYLKGGDLSAARSAFPEARIFPLSSHFEAPFFETKKVLHLPLNPTKSRICPTNSQRP